MLIGEGLDSPSGGMEKYTPGVHLARLLMELDIGKKAIWIYLLDLNSSPACEGIYLPILRPRW
jgi:hypothetical protein